MAALAASRAILMRNKENKDIGKERVIKKSILVNTTSMTDCKIKENALKPTIHVNIAHSFFLKKYMFFWGEYRHLTIKIAKVKQYLCCHGILTYIDDIT